MVLAGVDLAWQSSNPTAIAFGDITDQSIVLTDVRSGLVCKQSVLNSLIRTEGLAGIAIDAPLIINNKTGQRNCERELSRDYGSKHASCHTSNQTLYPNADSAWLSKELSSYGFKHCGLPSKEKWQVECYPHPALIELFDLEVRHLYKKGSADTKRLGQQQLAELLLNLESFIGVSLKVPSAFKSYFQPEAISRLKGKGLKQNEDVLDAVVCLIIASLYQMGHPFRVYGECQSGYIVVPSIRSG